MSSLSSPEDSDLSPRKVQEAAAAEGMGPGVAGAMAAPRGLLALEPGKMDSALGCPMPSGRFPVLRTELWEEGGTEAPA